MVNIGFSEETIIAKIQSSNTDFDTSIPELKKMKEAGISEAVITEMIQQTSKVNNTASNEAIQNEKSGIYVKDGTDFQKIYPTAFSSRDINTLGVALTFGLADANVVSAIRGAHSHNIVKSIKPEFYFFFNKSNSTSFNAFNVASSPYEFMLVKLESEDDNRKLSVGKANAYAGQKTGVNKESIIKFTVTPISEYEFMVVPEQPLKSGEYCFFYQGAMPQGGFSNQSVYDFTIPANTVATNSKTKYQIGDKVWIKGFLIPFQGSVINIKMKGGNIVYTIKSEQTGMEEDYYEWECHATKDEAKNTKKIKYEELEKKYHQMKSDLEKKIADQQEYIKDLQSIIDKLNNK